MARTTKKAEAGATAPADAAAEQAAAEQAAAEQAAAEQAAAEQAKAEQVAAGARVRVRTVTQQPRRRAGIAFGAEPVVLLVADLTDEQIAAIIADPLLVTETHEGDAPEGGRAD